MKITDALFGSPEHPGLAEKIALLAGALFFGTADGAAAGADAAIGEGFFSRFLGGASRAFDLAVDAQILSDLFNIRGRQGAAGQGRQEEVAGLVREALKSHSLLREQLQEHAGKKGIAKRLAEYAQSGIHLPSEDVLKNSYRSLRVVLHPDKNNNSEKSKEFFQKATEAYETLLKPEVREAYAEAVAKNPEAMEKLQREMGNIHWKEFHGSANQLKLSFEGKNKTYSKMQVWLSELNGYQKTGLAFAAVASVALVGSLIARITQPKREHAFDDPTQKPPLSAAREAAFGAINGGISGGVIAVSASAVHGFFAHRNAKNLTQTVMRQVHTTHFMPIVAFTAGFAALGAAVRTSGANQRNHKRAVDASAGFASRVQSSTETPDTSPAR